MNNTEFKANVAAALKIYAAMTPEQKAKHDYAQRRSFVRGMCPSRMEYAEWCRVVDRVMPDHAWVMT